MQPPQDRRSQRRRRDSGAPWVRDLDRGHASQPVITELETLRADPLGSFQDRDERREKPAKDATVERVGGRAAFRTGVAVLAVGLMFVAGLLLKPWAGGPFTGGTARPTPLPPDRTSLVPAATQVALLPGFDILDLHSIDWRSLGFPDSHQDWGISTATVLPLAHPSGVARSLSPQLDWIAPVTDSSSGDMTATFGVGYNFVFGLAVTWPRNVIVEKVQFTYVGPLAQRIDGFTPMTELAAVPATQEPAIGNDGFDGPAPSSTPESVRSGSYWIAPVEQRVVQYIGSAADSWRFQPWWWPDGEYQVAVVTNEGLRTMTVRLQPQ
jgi:hypothetical protein